VPSPISLPLAEYPPFSRHSASPRARRHHFPVISGPRVYPILLQRARTSIHPSIHDIGPHADLTPRFRGSITALGLIPTIPVNAPIASTPLNPSTGSPLFTSSFCSSLLPVPFLPTFSLSLYLAPQELRPGFRTPIGVSSGLNHENKRKKRKIVGQINPRALLRCSRFFFQ